MTFYDLLNSGIKFGDTIYQHILRIAFKDSTVLL